MGISAWLRSADSRPERGWHHLHSETVVPASLDDTFAFFANASNLERLTPPWLNFEIRTQAPLVMRAGAEIDYRIRLYGLPIPWRSRIDVWEPGHRFVDRQIIGPYLWWSHEHRFEVMPGGVRVIDHVEYVPRCRWLSAPLVSRDLRRIFAYRRSTLQEIFGAA